MRRRVLKMLLIGILSVAVTAGPTSAAPPSTETSPALEAATERAIELERTIAEHRADMIALEERIDVTNLRIYRQQEELADARVRMAEARDLFESRIIRMYKSARNNSMAILLTSESVSDFYARALMLTRIAQQDRNALSAAAVAASEAEYQAAYLDDLRAQDIALRREMEMRTTRLEEALAEQNALVQRLTEEEKKRLEAERAAAEAAREQWRASSVPIGEGVPLRPVTVEPYAERFYLAPEYQPALYRSTGKTMLAVCSWYGNEFHGRRTASGQIFNEEDLTCASRTLPFGTRLALTRKNRRIIVVVTDRGPFIAGRDLDLSKAAARELGFSGVEEVHVEFVEAVE
jgi:rare lipoprotein A